ncbi:MAG TPA: dephospho-CoA kinase [Mariprofundaceae bacterium]|nr:dephospho-CoA kinase [Mariprofundaceae bacterium]
MSDEVARIAPAVVGLTGGIGSGKSTVASMFAALGVPVLDLDEVGRRVTAPGSDGLEALVLQFGHKILDGDQLNRRKLAEISFACSEKTAQLNNIVHPLIWQEEESWRCQQHAPYLLIEASVLIESKGYDRMDHLVVVMADLAIRRERVLQRRGMNEPLFESIIDRQCDDADRLRLADDIVENNSDIESLQANVESLHLRLTERFAC